VFFVISGFVIAFSASRKNAAQFVVSRAGRLYPAAWICASISMIVAPRPIANYFGSIALFPLGPWVNGVYWTLAVEIAFYALIAVALWRRWSLHRVAIALGTFSALCCLVRSAGLDLPVGPYGHYGCYFAFGMLLFERRSLGFATLFFAAGFIGIYWAAADLGFGFLAPFVWALSTLLCVAVVFRNELVCRITRAWPTRTLGLMTYPLYLVHDSVGTPILRFGIAAAVALSLAVAFAILPLEGFIRRRVFGPIHDRLPTGNPL
jgi:peptidoglycan/LPS O-acetylase OafA/YrhL